MSVVSLKALSSVAITILCENTARGAGILGEHGLAWWIDTGDRRILFDLGQGMSLLENAKKLNLTLADADAVVLSHGHYDHLGGWAVLPQEVKERPVFLHPDALLPKFQRRANGRIDPAGDVEVVESLRVLNPAVIAEPGPREVADEVWMTGQVPRSNDYEDTGGDFVQDSEGKVTDPLNDDQSLFFRTSQGMVVIIGCAHSGLINTLRYVQQLTGERIHAVIGGMHLLFASPERMRRTIEDLEKIGPDWIGPNHCTGDAAVAQLTQAFKTRSLECHAGQTLTFPITPSV